MTEREVVGNRTGKAPVLASVGPNEHAALVRLLAERNQLIERGKLYAPEGTPPADVGWCLSIDSAVLWIALAERLGDVAKAEDALRLAIWDHVKVHGANIGEGKGLADIELEVAGAAVDLWRQKPGDMTDFIARAAGFLHPNAVMTPNLVGGIGRDIWHLFADTLTVLGQPTSRRWFGDPEENGLNGVAPTSEPETELSDSERADRFLNDMVAFGQEVMAAQLGEVRREDTLYNKHAFDWACDGFMVGAMTTFAEKFTFPTGPRERATLGLINYLTKVRGSNFEEARERAATLYNFPDGSKGKLLFDLGYRHWQNPQALRTYFEQPPGELESQAWADRMDRRRLFIIWGAITIGLMIAAFAAGYLLTAL